MILHHLFLYRYIYNIFSTQQNRGVSMKLILAARDRMRRHLKLRISDYLYYVIYNLCLHIPYVCLYNFVMMDKSNNYVVTHNASFHFIFSKFNTSKFAWFKSYTNEYHVSLLTPTLWQSHNVSLVDYQPNSLLFINY